MQPNLEQFSITELHRHFTRRVVSPREYGEHMLGLLRLEQLNAITAIDEEAARLNAEASEQRYMRGEPLGMLDGIMIGIKDVIETRGIPTRFGCEAYDAFIPEQDAFVVERLKQGGANISVKTNTSQFAMGPMGDVSYHGPVRNPHDPLRISGGSSSGSGSSVAGYLCTAALGTDSGGSIRLPAALCGVVGLKPTFSLVSNEGVMPVNASIDTVGPMTRSVEDNALVLNSIAGYNSRDWRSAPLPERNYLAAIHDSIAGCRIAFAADTFDGPLAPAVRDAIASALQAFGQLGARVRSEPLPDLQPWRTAHQLLLMAGAYQAHQHDLEQHSEQIYEQVRTRLLQGRIHSCQYVEYERSRSAMIRMLLEWMGDCDIVLLPTTPATAALIGAEAVEMNGELHSPLTLYPTYTWIASFSGLPCLSLPIGKDEQGLPIGLSLMARPFHEAQLYRFASQLERCLQ
ncbi:amidase [Paenibacillus senegalimassiliensis]|uniref:amidase n=1 Tax=Paenibacillus senegalimassiliensis TaxID=1737426 RepID=UPI00073E9091|nr:amidase [Paenibacillus senegalimassiliensis]